MSVRFHRGTPLLTLFHDPKSAASRRLLAQLQRKLAPKDASAEVGDASAYLRLAASSSTDTPLAELEVRDRHKAPPTEQQWKTIRAYLPSHIAAPSTVADKQQAYNATKQGADSTEQASIADAQAAMPTKPEGQAAQQASSESRQVEEDEDGADTAHLPVRLRPGPILIAWEAGKVATDEESALRMLHELEEEGKGQMGQAGTWGCVVC